MNLLEELKWRGLVAEDSSVSGNLNQLLNKEKTTFYVGTDPTGPSLHIGHLLAFIVARLLQNHGHKPIILVGGATASLGDPSFKAEERKLLSMETIFENAERIKKQLSHLIDFNSTEENAAIMVNNYDWMKDMTFLDFIRDIGKLLTVNYMTAKESVKRRLERPDCGLSFTEFSYQLLQGYDFLVLNKKYNCKLQIGGSDQFGNAMTGVELIRKSGGNAEECGVMTWPLVTRADGTKFGKSEGGKNIWLDREMTSPYEFYQFWLNQSDDDAEKFIKMFTLLDVKSIESLIIEHHEAPHLRILQKTLAYEVTKMVHSVEDAEFAVKASNALFDKNTTIDTFKGFNREMLLDIFKGVPQYNIRKSVVDSKPTFVDFANEITFANSKGEARREIKNGAYSMNLRKVTIDDMVSSDDLINDEFIILKKGKRYSLVTVH